MCCQPALPPPTTAPPVTHITCPSGSVCLDEGFCIGDFLSTSGDFVPNVNGISWSKCYLGNNGGSGVCCRTAVTPSCGVSHYANKVPNARTSFHNPQLAQGEVDFGEMPWQAIIFDNHDTFMCGATLISKRHLLTVAHCVHGVSPQNIHVRLGEWQVNSFNEPFSHKDYSVRYIKFHPGYYKGPEWNNIVIIELTSPVTLQYNINSVCLPFGRQPFIDRKRCLVSGWGKSSFQGRYTNILKKVDVPLINNQDCQNKLQRTRLGRFFRLHSTFMCAGGEAGKDACVGDGGGPLICYDDSSQSYVQVGITAWGIGCGKHDVPGVYTDISKYTSWISEQTGLGYPDPVIYYKK